jgi:uncharacterized protein YdaU (DUF1376 family)
MSQAPVMPVFTDALLGDTTYLSAEEFGAYCRILFATWRNNGIPFVDDNERLSRITGVSPQRWSRIRKTLAQYFDLSAGTWIQKRLEKEWNRTQILIADKREKGIRGANARWLKNNDSEMAHANAPANGSGNSQGNGSRYANHNHNLDNPQTPLGRGLRRNGRDTDPFHVRGLSSAELVSRFNAAAHGSDEREALRQEMERPPS